MRGEDVRVAPEGGREGQRTLGSGAAADGAPRPGPGLAGPKPAVAGPTTGGSTAASLRPAAGSMTGNPRAAVWDYRDAEDEVRSEMSYDGGEDRDVDDRLFRRDVLESQRLLAQAVQGLLMKSERQVGEGGRRRAEVLCKALHVWLGRHAFFDGKDITRYLREFELELRLIDPTGDELIGAFMKTVDPRVAARAAMVKGESATWNEFKVNLRDAFIGRDRTRTTASSFLAWVREAKTGSVEDILADFELKFEELAEEERAMFADRPLIFSRCLPKAHRLAFLEPLCKKGRLSATWEQVRERAREFAGAMRYAEIDERLFETARDDGSVQRPDSWGAFRTKEDLGRRPPDNSDASPRAAVPAATASSRYAGPSPVVASSEMEQLRRQMADLSIQMNRLTQTAPTAGQPSGSPHPGGGARNLGQAPSRDRCIWCDEAGHRRAECTNFMDAVSNKIIQLQNGLVCRPDGTVLPTRFGSGGIKRTVMEEIGRGGSGGTATVSSNYAAIRTYGVRAIATGVGYCSRMEDPWADPPWRGGGLRLGSLR